MSEWRRKASELLPEYQSIISSKEIDNPMQLWIELYFKFAQLCEEKPPQLNKIKNIWNYCRWCLEYKNQDISTAAALGFCEHLLDTEEQIKIIPKIISKDDYIGLKQLLLYHNNEKLFNEVLYHCFKL